MISTVKLGGGRHTGSSVYGDEGYTRVDQPVAQIVRDRRTRKRDRLERRQRVDTLLRLGEELEDIGDGKVLLRGGGRGLDRPNDVGRGDGEVGREEGECLAMVDAAETRVSAFRRRAYIEKWPKPWKRGKAEKPVLGRDMAALATRP